MYELAKSAREKMKAKARSMAAAPSLAKGQDTTSADWTPAEALNADAKTGARPVGKARLYNKGGKVAGGKAVVRADRKPRKSGGRVETDIGVGISNRDVRAANEKREGIKHVGGFKKGGATKDAGVKEKKALGAIDPSPKRGAAGHYKKGGRTKKDVGGGLSDILQSGALGGLPALMSAFRKPADTKSGAITSKDLPAELIPPTPAARKSFVPALPASAQQAIGAVGRKKGGKVKKADGGYTGGSLPDPREGLRSEGAKVSEKPATFSKEQKESYSREEGYSDADRRTGRAKGGSTYGTSTPLRLVKTIGTGKKTAKVYKDPDWDEYRVKHFIDGVHQKEADYHASDKDDAMDTANYFTREGQKNGGRTGRATGGPAISMPGLKGIGKKASKKGGKTDINIVINAGKAPPRHPAAGLMPPAGGDAGLPPLPMPPMGAGAPPPAAPPMPGPGAGPMVPPGLPLPGRKAGGRITKVASSYKDMEAGAATGEGRLQKTDIAKHHKGAPARKAGGRISKVAKSYKDMTAGAGDGEGRLQKTDIAKAKMGRGK